MLCPLLPACLHICSTFVGVFWGWPPVEAAAPLPASSICCCTPIVHAWPISCRCVLGLVAILKLNIDYLLLVIIAVLLRCAARIDSGLCGSVAGTRLYLLPLQ